MAISCKTSRRSAVVVAALLMGAAISAVRGEAPAVLTQIPADASAFVVVNNVKALSTKLSNTLTRLNLPIPLPPDLAGYALRNIGINDGFDQDSSAAMIVLKAPNEAEPFSGQAPAVLLLPTTDPKAMLQSFTPTPPDKEGISEVSLPGDSGEKGYVISLGKWVAFAQDRGVLTTYLSHKGNLAPNLSPDTLKTLESNDVVVWTNTGALGAPLAKLLEDKQQEFTGMLDLMNLNNNQDQTASAVQKEVVNQYFAAFKQYLQDAESSLFTLRLSDSGVTLGSVSNFKPASPFGKFVAAQKSAPQAGQPSAPPLTLKGLPDGDFLFAGAFSFDPHSVSDLVTTVSKQVLANEVLAQDPKIGDYRKVAGLYAQVASITTGANFVVLPAPAGGKSGVISAAALVDTTDPEKYRSLQLEMLKNPMMQQSMNPDIQQTVTVTPDAVTIKDVKLTKTHLAWKLREETPDHPVTPADKQAYEMVQKIYGPDGVTSYFGLIEKQVLVVLGSDAGILEPAVTAAVDKSDTLNNNPAISAVHDQVVPNTIAVGYLPMARVLNMIGGMMQPAEAGATPPPAPAGGPPAAPVVWSAGVNNSTLTAEMHVPVTAITSTMEAASRLKGMMAPPAPPAP